MLLTADLHLTDREVDEYRWDVFNRIREWLAEPAQQAARSTWVVIAGDISDTRDRHSARFITRLTHELITLTEAHAQVWITQGNHDAPVNGPGFWEYLSAIPGITYVTKPWYPDKAREVLLLPYAHNPEKEWVGIEWETVKCAILHQCMTGAIGNNGHKLVNERMPILPRGKTYYAGDIHTPQKIGPVEYIGAPHPINFGDDYTCRMLEISDVDYKIMRQITLDPLCKHMLDDTMEAWLHGTPDFNYALTGDQAKVRVRVPLSQIEQWPIAEQRIREWAVENKVKIDSIHPIIEGNAAEPESAQLIADPMQILLDFIVENELSDALAEVGMGLLEIQVKTLGNAPF